MITRQLYCSSFLLCESAVINFYNEHFDPMGTNWSKAAGNNMQIPVKHTKSHFPTRSVIKYVNAFN